MKKTVAKITAICTSMLLIASINVYAQDSSRYVVDIGHGVTMDIEKVAAQNGVDPVALKEAIERQSSEERFSPFSDLVTKVPNTKASESITVSDDDERSVSATTVSKTDQDATAYVAASGALTASGKTPAVGMCAMHIDVSTKTGTTSSTLVKMGTKLSLTKSVDINGTSKDSLVVEDRGNPSNRTTYWIDIYFGQSTDATKKAAINYGVKTVSYSYTY